MSDISFDSIVWDPSIYPRSKWNTSTIDRYLDAYESGAKFPPLVLEEGTNRLLDGKHRYEMYKRAGVVDVEVEWHKVPEGLTVKYYAGTLSARHGDRLSNSDIKEIALEEFESNPNLKASQWAKGLGITERTVQNWVSHITNRAKQERWGKAMRLSLLGWTQAEIGERLEVSVETVQNETGKNRKNAFFTGIPEAWNGQWLADEANRLGVPLGVMWAAALSGEEDGGKMGRLGIKVQPYDVWQFSGCSDLMGDNWPGRIPGELVCHVLYYYTGIGDLVVDPMVGSGTTLDACLLMNRKCRGYDVDKRALERVDVEEWDISVRGWPGVVSKADLIFWDPPYFDKKNAEYCVESISNLGVEEFLDFFRRAFGGLYRDMRVGGVVAFLMSDWNSEETGEIICVSDYIEICRDAGFDLMRIIQTPLSTQLVHPDIVNKFRESRRMARLGRNLIILRKT